MSVFGYVCVCVCVLKGVLLLFYPDDAWIQLLSLSIDVVSDVALRRVRSAAELCNCNRRICQKQ